MDVYELLRAVIALLFVLALVLLVAYVVKRFGLEKRWHVGKGTQTRLEIVERLIIDPKRQLVLIRKDKEEHLLLLGQQEQVISSDSREQTSDQ